MKPIISFLLFFAVISLSLFVPHAQADVTRETMTYGNLKYETADIGVTITGYVSDPVGDLEIPEKINGKQVFIIASEAFKGCKSITSIKASSVNIIESYAFSECTALKSADFPSVMRTETCAFAECSSLKTAQLPFSMSIGSAAFKNCIALESVNIESASNLVHVFSGCRSLKEVYFGNNKHYTFSEGAIYEDMTILVDYPTATGSIHLDERITVVGAYAFEGCDITDIEMPSVLSISMYAFSDCKKLKEVDFHAVNQIGLSAFQNCESLVSVDFAGNTNRFLLSHFAFTGCKSLTSAYIYSDAPYSESVFDGCSEDFKVYYDKGTNEWNTIWKGYPTEEFVPVTATFVDSINSETIDKRITHPNGKVYPPVPPVHSGMEFAGWDADCNNIIENITIKAIYNPVECVIGDVNGDGTINTSDAVVVLKFAAGMIQLDEKQAGAGDCNHDSNVNTADAVLILKYAAGMITAF